MSGPSLTYKVVGLMTKQFVLGEDAPKGGFRDAFKTNEQKKERVRAHRRYERYYCKFIERGSRSITVNELTKAVRRANDMVNAWFKAGKPAEVADATADAQLNIYRAADWLRRYVYDRSDDTRWFDEVERSDAQKLIQSLDASAETIMELLKGNARTSAIIMKQQSSLKVLSDDPVGSNHPLVQRLKTKLDSLKRHIEALEGLYKDAEDVFEDNELDQALGVLLSRTNSLFRAVDKPQLLARNARAGLVPAWRNKGLPSLGPFGIQPCEFNGDPERFIETNFREIFGGRAPTEDQILDKLKDVNCKPTYHIASSHKRLQTRYGARPGRLSPFGKVTIPKGDDTFRLIRIPVNAKYFAWAYPILESVEAAREKFQELQNDKVPVGPMDYFCLFGGYVYFDKHMEFIRANGLHLGSIQLQFSSPYKLSPKIYEELRASNRFANITLDFPVDPASHPKRFAWILPNEFTKEKDYGEGRLPWLHPGAFAYEYSNLEANNVFVLAATDTVLAKRKSEEASHHD